MHICSGEVPKMKKSWYKRKLKEEEFLEADCNFSCAVSKLS